MDPYGVYIYIYLIYQPFQPYYNHIIYGIFNKYIYLPLPFQNMIHCKINPSVGGFWCTLRLAKRALALAGTSGYGESYNCKP